VRIIIVVEPGGVESLRTAIVAMVQRDECQEDYDLKQAAREQLLVTAVDTVNIPPHLGKRIWCLMLILCALQAALAQMAPRLPEVPFDDSHAGHETVNRLDNAIAHYRKMQGYQATIRASRRDGGEIIRYAWQRPGRIRMEFEKPHKGARLIYVPDGDAEGRVYLWPFGGNLMPPMNLSPDNPLLQSPSGQRVDRSDIGTLLDNIRSLAKSGRIDTLGDESVDGRAATHVAVTGEANAALGKVHRYDVWFDDESDFPLKIVSRDADGAEIETVLMEDVVIDPEFPPRYFSP
jgi:outer membrane lipoprotein-sorting protein